MDPQNSLTSKFRECHIAEGLQRITSYLSTDSPAMVNEKYQILVSLMNYAEQKAFDSSKTNQEYSSILNREIRKIVKYGHNEKALESLLTKYEKQGRITEEEGHPDHDCFECIRKAMNLPSIEKINPVTS